ncbi:MAG: hypothetical protein KGZ96_04290 [Clostridia bacterium]|nr:hypothetical protein [Clostridia bacterium]
MGRITFFLMLALIIIPVGCTQQEIKEGQVYVVSNENNSDEQLGDKLNIEGRIPFQKYVNESLMAEQIPNQILLTFSPDGKEMYLMERIETESFPKVIKGEPGEKVRIIIEDITTKNQKIIVENIPFVNRVLWNTEGNMVAFGGGERLTVYDVKSKNTVMEEKLAQDTINYFFWSPISDSKLYSEKPDLTNGTIYYIDSQKKVEAYETREETYYKGKLDSNYYYGTKWDLANGDINTVILDKQGKIIKVLTPGRFRDAYQKSLLIVGERGFGLYYIRDINKSEELIALTQDYVYDVKFVADGKIVYTTGAEDIENNLFYLHMVSNQGSQLKKFKVSGSSIAVLPDGNSGYISGPQWEPVDFVQNKLGKDSLEKAEETDNLPAIYAAIRGAMSTLSSHELNGEKNWNRLKKYFINSSLPEQWAYFDVEAIFQEKTARLSAGNNSTYIMRIVINNYSINHTGDAVSAGIRVYTKTPNGRGITNDYALELIKKDGNWYVTGFSTFPYSPDQGELQEIVRETVAKLQTGTIFSGELENKQILIGQIQFWRSGIPHLAPSVESADSVKVFLQVKNQGKQEIYKLVLEKENQNSWKPVKLTRKELSSL